MDINRKIFMGIVEDNKDPNRKGRIKVRVQTLFHCLAIEDIPYASPFAGLAGKRFEIPAIGKIVNVIFFNNDLYDPYYIYSENYNINLQNKLNSLSDDQYIDFIALLFDQKTQIYVKDDELTIDQLLNKITINNTSINLELKDNNRFVNIGTKDSTQDAVLGTNFFKWMDKFIDELSNPSSLIGNYGAPILKPILNQLCQEYKLKRPTFVSEHVKIVDNGKVNILKRTPDTDNRKNDVDLVIPIDECGEYEKPEGGEDISNQISKIIDSQNQKSCKELKNATATKSVPYVEHPSANSNLELTSNEVLKVWSKEAENEIKKLHPSMRPIVIKFFNLCEAEGYHLVFTDGFRSYEDQKRIKDEYDRIGKSKFAASPGNSPHEYGIAIDVKCDKAGKVGPKLTRSSSSCFDYEDCNDAWLKIGEIGKSLGLRWGLDFNDAKEAWHFDMYNFMSNEMQSMWVGRKKEWPKDSNGWVILESAPKYDTSQYNQQNYAQNQTTETSKKPCKHMDKFNQNDPNEKVNAESDIPESKPKPKQQNNDDKCSETKSKNGQDYCCDKAINGAKKNYPNTPIIDKPPATTLNMEDAVSYLSKKYDEQTAKMVFAIVYNEASKKGEQFVSPGGYNYSGVQTDAGKWSNASFSSQYLAVDSGGICRMFGVFQDNYAFLDFMASKAQSKGFLSVADKGAEGFAEKYLNRWVAFDMDKNDPVRYNKLFPSKEKIYNSAVEKFNKYA